MNKRYALYVSYTKYLHISLVSKNIPSILKIPIWCAIESDANLLVSPRRVGLIYVCLEDLRHVAYI
jgi:hypothetical protein